MKKILKIIVIIVFFLQGNVLRVNAQAHHVYYSFQTTENKLALTFDDGPSSKNTNQVLDILKKYNVKATFFLLGENMVGNETIIRRIVDEGHEIGLHTFSHPNFYKLNKDQIHNEIVKNIQTLKRIIPYNPKYIRPPYGIVTEDFLNLMDLYQLKIIAWSNDSLDWKSSKSSDDIVNLALSKIHPGSIILMHDKSNNYLCSRKALPRIIDKCLKLGYEFGTISEFI